MTPSEWLTSTDLSNMIRFAQPKITSRQLRLFACACCRRISHFVEDDRTRWALEVAERFADRLVDEQARRIAQIGAQTATTAASWSVDHDGPAAHAARAVHQVIKIAEDGAHNAAACVENAVAVQAIRLHPSCPSAEVRAAAQAGERAAQCRLLRHIVGDPFGGVVGMPAVSPLVRGLATAVYEQDGSAVPALHDALVEAGLEVVAAHFSDREEWHPKGCHVLDGLRCRAVR
jgi:hypothetical protein